MIKIVEYPTIKLNKLKPHPNNPRSHTEEQVTKIARSIKELGWGRPIIISTDYYILAGHGAAEAADQLGYDEVPYRMMQHKGESPEALAYMVADNKLTDESDWNYTDLEIIFEDLKLEDFEVELTGFNDTEVIEVGEKVHGPQEVIEDDFNPDEPIETHVQPGDIYQLGSHRLMCGDSTQPEDIEQLMDGEKAELLFTSPPYNVGSLNIDGQEETQPKYNTPETPLTQSDYLQFLINFIEPFKNNADEVFINLGMVENNKKAIIELLSHYKNQFKDLIFWNKNTAAPHIHPGIINNKVELIIALGDGKRKFKHAQFKQGTYWNVIEGNNASGNEFSKIHKATFPLYLPHNIIANFSNPNSIITDPFGGTGTTLIACEQLQRNCYMMELDPQYCDVIITRWETFTGQKAQKI